MRTLQGLLGTKERRLPLQKTLAVATSEADQIKMLHTH